MKEITDTNGNNLHIDITKIYMMKNKGTEYLIYVGTETIMVTEETYNYILSYIQ